MTYIVDRSDASLYYRASSALDIASMDTSAAWGNLADAMKNATVVIPNTFVLEPLAILPSPVKDAEGKSVAEESGSEPPAKNK